jgi:hypothetical protein
VWLRSLPASDIRVFWKEIDIMSQTPFQNPNDNSPGIRVPVVQSVEQAEVRFSSQRQTPDSSFGTLMRRGLSKSASAVERMAASAGYAIPGGAVVGAAIEGASAVRDEGGAGVGSESGASFLAQRAKGGDTGARMALATQEMQQINFTNNVQLLHMQNSVQNEQKHFSMMSNISKTRHEAARNSISNLK